MRSPLRTPCLRADTFRDTVSSTLSGARLRLFGTEKQDSARWVFEPPVRK